jgi:hypothetical protein
MLMFTTREEMDWHRSPGDIPNYQIHPWFFKTTLFTIGLYRCDGDMDIQIYIKLVPLLQKSYVKSLSLNNILNEIFQKSP